MSSKLSVLEEALENLKEASEDGEVSQDEKTQIELLNVQVNQLRQQIATSSPAISSEIIDQIEANLKIAEKKIAKGVLSKEVETIENTLSKYLTIFEKNKEFKHPSYTKTIKLLETITAVDNNQFSADLKETKKKQLEIIQQQKKNIDALLKEMNDKLSETVS